MRYIGRALTASAFVLGACAGGDNKTATDTATAAPAATTPAATTPAATTPAATTAAAPITGTTHEVKMIGDEKGYKFVPAQLTVKPGDGIKFIMVTGGPHNVGFDASAMAPDMVTKFSANMPDAPSAKMSAMESPMLVNANDSYTVSFAGVKPGTYSFHCTPHLAMNMKGSVTVQ
ncbi:MAG: plastocyanin/azurin family copper-binding protein [Gemmatimonadaceae bacterium]